MSTPVDFLSDGGEMGLLTRGFDWANSSLGTPETWPQSLRLTIRLALNTQHPMFIWWGPDLIQFYNDAYAKTMGPERHPSALGAGGKECWAEIWDIIGPQVQHVMSGQGSTWDEDRLVPVTRRGQREDVWWTYSFSPIDLEGDVGGVLVVCSDVTEQHRSRETLRAQANRLEQLFEQAPGFMAILQGEQHVFELTNTSFRDLVGDRDFVGRAVRDVIPEVAGQGFFELLDEAYQGGRAHVGSRMPIVLHSKSGAVDKRAVLNFVYQPIFDRDGRVSGIFVQGADVSDHVRAEEHLRLVNDELKHRVKNTLAMVSAIATQTLRGQAHDLILDTFTKRLAAFAAAHDILTANAWATADIHKVVEGALAPYRTGEGRFFISGPAIVLGTKQALSLALALHELATNAVKYGALSTDEGRIELCWQIQNPGSQPLFFLSWKESGGPNTAKPVKLGFGTKLIDRVLSADFGGTITVTYGPGGLELQMVSPSAQLDNALVLTLPGIANDRPGLQIAE